MQIGEMKARPPHVKFKLVAQEDRTKSIETGHPCFIDVPYAVITALGSRDSIEKPVMEWLEQSEQQVRDERLPAEWLERYRAAYNHWKAGEDIPVDGTALSNWPVISPSELQTCKGINVYSIEQLAGLNEEGVKRLGMGGNTLRQRAQQYLAASDGPGKLVAENTALRTELEAKKARLEVLEARCAQLELLVPNAKSPVVVSPASPDVAEKV